MLPCNILFLALALIIISVHSYPLNNKFTIAKRINKYDTSICANENENENNAESEQLTKLFELIVSSIENGKEDDLVKAGLKVSKISAKETLDNKINDPQLQDIIFGSASESDEIDIIQRLQNAYESGDERRSDADYDEIGDVNGFELDDSVLQELKNEAYETLEAMRTKGSAMGRLLENDEFATYITPELEYQKSERNRMTPPQESQQPIDPTVWGKTLGVESLLSEIDHSRFPEFAGDTYTTSMSPPGPTITNLDFAEEVEESAVDDDSESEDDTDSAKTIEDTFMNKNEDGTIGVGTDKSRRVSVSGGRSKYNHYHFELPIHDKYAKDNQLFSYNTVLYMTPKDIDYDVPVSASVSTSESSRRGDKDMELLDQMMTAADTDSDTSENTTTENKFVDLLRQTITQATSSTLSDPAAVTDAAIGDNSKKIKNIDETRRQTLDAITTGQVEKLGNTKQIHNIYLSFLMTCFYHFLFN